MAITVSYAIEEAIKACGSQRVLAEKAGVSQAAISKYLRGVMIPTGVTAKKLSEATGGLLKPSDFAPHIFD